MIETSVICSGLVVASLLGKAYAAPTLLSG